MAFTVNWVINDVYMHWQTTTPPAVMEKSVNERWGFPWIIAPQQLFLKMHHTGVTASAIMIHDSSTRNVTTHNTER